MLEIRNDGVSGISTHSFFNEYHELTESVKAQRKPAPALALTSVMGRMKSEGTLLSLGSILKDRCVLAMQTGKFPNPFQTGKNKIIKAGGKIKQIFLAKSTF